MPAPFATAHALTLDHVTVDVQRRCVEGRRLGMVRVLEDCSLHVPAGESLALVGPAACGKSTLLDLFAGFVRPLSGRVLVGGERVDSPAPDRGFVQPSFGLFPWRSARANVTFAAGPEVARSADAVLDLTGVAHVADRPVGRLTAAQKQRVALAKALVHGPGVLLLDDPFRELDPAERALLQEELIRIQREAAVTLVIATGNVAEAVRLGTRVAVLSPLPGRVENVVEVIPGRHIAAARAIRASLAEADRARVSELSRAA
ncbi:MAG TPA: ATP-binding cassette domain-containing protein [Propionibacterium sp.]|jgi:NitT/TauT family transport system ATP-binding protein|nr:ATP-binding cassette domain-containing protein [Propionibacterium sp.]